MEFGAGVVFVGLSLEPVDPESAPRSGAENDDTGGKEYGAAVSDLAVMDGAFPLTTRGDSRTNLTVNGSDASAAPSGPIPGTLSAGEDTSWIRPPITPRGGLTDLTDRVTGLPDRRHRIAGRRGGVLHDPSHIPVRAEGVRPRTGQAHRLTHCEPSGLSSFTLIHSYSGA